ncbi:DNA adenine methylase [Burkholderia cepacia]|uniref:DNA adenine methylase n=1 Tax=Burkholderia cepacia TaxID=292 RepID=UPI001CF5FBA6|nr:DNA adenine methylase [Burkholderia cepacia]MCA8078992.1 DNA adenine methylase [Burkholderia cepacia]
MPKLLSSPLRYPGSKVGLVDWFESFLENHNLTGVQFVEPYAGSAALSLNLLSRGAVSSVMLFERDPLLFSFWYSVFRHPDELIAHVERFEASLATRAELSWLREMDEVSEDVTLMGFAGLLFNRTSFSGVLHAGPIGGVEQRSAYSVDCRYNKSELIRRIVQYAKLSESVDVYFGDAVHALSDARATENENRLFYVDPPYYVQGRKLYRYSYEFSDHMLLSETLATANYRWVLSYDDHAAIRHFYRNFRLFEPTFRYSSRVPKNERELIFTNIEPADVALHEADPAVAVEHVVADPSTNDDSVHTVVA